MTVRMTITVVRSPQKGKINEEELVPVVQLSRQTRSGRSIGISFLDRCRDCFLY